VILVSFGYIRKTWGEFGEFYGKIGELIEFNRKYLCCHFSLISFQSSASDRIL